MFKNKQFKVLTAVSVIIIISFIALLLVLKPSCCLKKAAMTQSYSFSPILSLSPFDVVYGELNNAQLPIIVYENYLDQFSILIQDSLSQAKNDFNNLVFIYRPYINSHDTFSQEMALVLACANEQGKGKEVRENLFKARQSFSLSDQFIIDNQLNKEELSVCLNNSHLKDNLLQISNDAKANHIYGSPTILVGSELVIGARPYEDYTDSGGDKVEGLYSVIARQVDIN